MVGRTACWQVGRSWVEGGQRPLWVGRVPGGWVDYLSVVGVKLVNSVPGEWEGEWAGYGGSWVGVQCDIVCREECSVPLVPREGCYGEVRAKGGDEG